MAMATPPLSLILLFIFSLLSILISTTTAKSPIISQSKSATSDFIWASCKSTQYPSLCYHSLSGYAKQIQHSERRLALTSLAVSLTRVRSAAQFVSNISKGNKGIRISHREYEAVKDCIETMGDSVDQLSRSIKEMGHMGRHTNGQDFMWHLSNVQTWVSAALTNENTCVDGFSSGFVNHGRVKAAIKIRVTNVAQVTSNALALVNRFAARYKIGKDVQIP